MAELSRCGRCGLAIRWARTNNANWMPLDPPRKDFEPPFETQPTVYLNEETGIARVLSAAEISVWSEHLKAKLYLPHFGTCKRVLAARRGRRSA